MIRAAIVGGTGYGGMELLRLLLDHPGAEVTAITSRTREGPVAASHPHLRGLTELTYTKDRARDLAKDHDVLFFATPHGVAAREAPDVLAANADVRLVDLSGDHRLKDAAAYAEHYGKEHPHPASLPGAVYGTPECGAREALRGARLVANPGCHAYATLIALWPLQAAGLVAGPVNVCSVTGSSGSGATPGGGTHHPERAGDFRAYRPLRHQHAPEITQALAATGRPAPALAFVPHSAPLTRGIHVTAFVPVPAGEEEEAAATLRGAYEGEPFVRVLTEGLPQVRAVAGSNFADVAATPGDGLVCVTVAIDNLLKGMAGTAVQNVNLLFDLPEDTGLRTPGIGP